MNTKKPHFWAKKGIKKNTVIKKNNKKRQNSDSFSLVRTLISREKRKRNEEKTKTKRTKNHLKPVIGPTA